MKLLSTDYSLRLKTFEIYLSGCKGPHCSGCHNPESWNFEQGELITNDTIIKLKNKIQMFDKLIENIWILGGEPLDQDLNELVNLCEQLKKLKKKIWIFTRYEISEVPEIVLNVTDYIKTGRYIPDLGTYMTDYDFMLSSKNQIVHKIR